MIEEVKEEKKMSFLQCFTYKQTWAFAAGKFMTDGVWWFFLFWTPSYLNTQFDIKTSDGRKQKSTLPSYGQHKDSYLSY